MGSSTFTGNLNDYAVSAEGWRGTKVNLAISRIAPSWRPVVGIHASGNSYFGWLSAVPLGGVQGTITYDGKDHAVVGLAYHDHNWGNTPPQNMFSRWIWGRILLKDYAVIFGELTSPDGKTEVPVFYLSQDGAIVLGDAFPDATLTLEDQTFTDSFSYPQTQVWRVQKSGFGTVELTLTHPKVITATPLASTRASLEAEKSTQPFYIRFLSDFILKIQDNGKTETKTGRALWELADWSQN